MTWPVALQFLLCPIVLFALLRVTAPYGRHHRPGWGPMLPSRLAWLLMELPALLVITVIVWRSPARHAAPALLPLAFWLTHYAYRTLLFPWLMRSSGRTFPLLLVVFAVAFNWLNGYNNGQALVVNGLADAPLWSPHFVAGSLLFWLGFWIHVDADRRIRNLRRDGERAHGIPRGGLFRWVSSPNYLGEMLQWTGWAILTASWAGWAFALFTVCNLAPRALSNHRWYREHFPDYPVDRKALVPGLI